MRVLLATLHFGLLRNFESVVEALAREGHEVLLAAEEGDRLGGDRLADALSTRSPNVRMVHVPRVDEPGVDLGQRARVALDYFRCQAPPFAESPKLAARLRERVPRGFLSLDRWLGRGAVVSLLSAIESTLEPSPAIRAWLEAQAPDVVLLTSLTHYRSLAPELHRAAASLGVPTVACIYSWDHLSSKAHLRRAPEAVFVWNDVQAGEARRLHGLPAEIIAVTGAQCYDQWRERRPSRDAAQFARDLGLDPAAPFLLYVCSALTPSPDEPAFVERWIAALRKSQSPRVREMGILIRPHPERLHEWAGRDLSQHANLVIRGGAPLDDSGKDEYFDTLSHAAGVVGLGTSAFLEAAVVGRPVFTITPPEFAVHQTSMQHFRYLLDVGQGLPVRAASIPEHVAQLEAVMDGDLSWRARQATFLDAFIRPSDSTRPATAVFVDAVRQAARTPVRPAPAASWRARWASRAAVSAARFGPVRGWLRDEHERAHHLGLQEKAAVKGRKRRERRRRQVLQLVRRLVPGSHPPSSS